MFTIRAKNSEKVEVNTTLENVREFFSDIKNYIDLMPGVESIHSDSNGIMHWKIRADIPLVGSIIQKFAVQLAEDSEERIEWIPVSGEQKNLMRYAADFFEMDSGSTVVQFTQAIELRRNNATDLHLLAGLAGETIISNEMTRRVAEVLSTFIQRARVKLESQ